MKKAISICCLSLVLCFVFAACSSTDEVSEVSVDPDLIQYSGKYLVDSIESSDNETIDKIVLSDNNLNELGLDQEELLNSFRIYEAQVIWDMNNQCFYLDKGYNIGQNNIAFANTILTLVKIIDTGEISYYLNDQDFKFEEFKVYNFCCRQEDKNFDSYFIYIPYEQGIFKSIDVDELDYTYVNCVYDDYNLYLATFQGMTGEGEVVDTPSYQYYGDPIAVRDSY